MSNPIPYSQAERDTVSEKRFAELMAKGYRVTDFTSELPSVRRFCWINEVQAVRQGSDDYSAASCATPQEAWLLADSHDIDAKLRAPGEAVTTQRLHDNAGWYTEIRYPDGRVVLVWDQAAEDESKMCIQLCRVSESPASVQFVSQVLL